MENNRLNIIENYKHPLNYGKPEFYTHTATYKNLSCGDEITVYFSIVENRIKDLYFTGSGCSISIATMSILSEEIKDKDLSYIENLDLSLIENQILHTKLSMGRYNCALIGVQAIKEAIKTTLPPK